MKQKRITQPCSLVLLFATTALTLLGLPHYTLGADVADWSLRSTSAPAAIGRGYSLSTGKVLNTCLIPNSDLARNEPSFDYDFTTNSIQGRDSYVDDMTPFANSVGNQWLKSMVEDDYTRSDAEDSSDNLNVRHLVAYMYMDRYYNSIDESNAAVIDSAKSLLNTSGRRPLYMEFFQACGPTFVRSVRLTAEVMGLFKYSSPCACSNFDAVIASALRGAVEGGETTVEDRRADVSLTTKVYGLSMNDQVDDIIVSNMGGFAKVADFAFRAMQNPKIGMLKSVEVVQWTNTPQFQRLGKLAEPTEISECRDGSTACDLSDPESLRTITISMSKKKYNLFSNAEHVLHLDEIMSFKSERMSKLNFCRLKLNNFPSEKRNKVLVNKLKHFFVGNDVEVQPENTPEVTSYDSNAVTVGRLINLFSDTFYVAERLKVKEYMLRYYNECLVAITGTSGGTDPAVLSHWLEVDACNQIMCTFPDSYFETGSNQCSRETYILDDDGIEEDNYWVLVDRFCSPELTDKDARFVVQS
mmetsp:Transcript_21425/g.48659  ORF Transcript_21425/g.48659 Transcript_21425/m.48659 type:complete len:527 (-) Transcript_21425:49-1629(-)